MNVEGLKLMFPDGEGEWGTLPPIRLPPLQAPSPPSIIRKLPLFFTVSSIDKISTKLGPVTEFKPYNIY